jgi:hypothetical protein
MGKYTRFFHYFTKLEEIIIEEPCELPENLFLNSNPRRITRIIFRDEGPRQKIRNVDDIKRKKD